MAVMVEDSAEDLVVVTEVERAAAAAAVDMAVETAKVVSVELPVIVQTTGHGHKVINFKRIYSCL